MIKTTDSCQRSCLWLAGQSGAEHTSKRWSIYLMFILFAFMKSHAWNIVDFVVAIIDIMVGCRHHRQIFEFYLSASLLSFQISQMYMNFYWFFYLFFSFSLLIAASVHFHFQPSVFFSEKIAYYGQALWVCTMKCCMNFGNGLFVCLSEKRSFTCSCRPLLFICRSSWRKNVHTAECVQIDVGGAWFRLLTDLMLQNDCFAAAAAVIVDAVVVAFPFN